MPVTSEMTFAGRLLQFRAGRIDKIKDRFKATLRLVQGMASHHHTRAAVPLALMFKSELDFDAFGKSPLCHQTNTLGCPLHLLISQVNGIGEIDGDPFIFVKF